MPTDASRATLLNLVADAHSPEAVKAIYPLFEQLITATPSADTCSMLTVMLRLYSASSADLLNNEPMYMEPFVNCM